MQVFIYVCMNRMIFLLDVLNCNTFELQFILIRVLSTEECQFMSSIAIST